MEVAPAAMLLGVSAGTVLGLIMGYFGGWVDNVIGRLIRARRPGRAIVREAERRQTEIIVLGAPRTARPQRELFSETVDFILKNAPCRVLVAAGKKAA